MLNGLKKLLMSLTPAGPAMHELSHQQRSPQGAQGVANVGNKQPRMGGYPLQKLVPMAYMQAQPMMPQAHTAGTLGVNYPIPMQPTEEMYPQATPGFGSFQPSYNPQNNGLDYLRRKQNPQQNGNPFGWDNNQPQIRL